METRTSSTPTGSVTPDQLLSIGTRDPTPSGAIRVGQLLNGSVNVMVLFNTQNNGQLQSLIDSAGRQPGYEREALTEEQFEENYAPSQTDYDKVISLLTQSGMSVTQTWGNRLMLLCRGSVTDVEETFGVEIGLYRYQNMGLYMNSKEIVVPALQDLGVSGIQINNLTMQPAITIGSPTQQSEIKENNSLTPYYGPALEASPRGLWYAYGTFNAIINNVWTGAGETIAIVDAYGDPTIISDLNYFNSYYNLPNCTVTISGTGGYDAGWAGETALDVEWAHAMAPSANITLQLAPDALNPDLFGAVNTLVSSSKPPNVISMSWSAQESSGSTAYSSIFSAAAGEGIDVYGSTGDKGAYNGGSTISVNYPAVDPNVMAVGGTTLYCSAYPTDSSKTPMVWNESGWSGSGGGYSTIFPEPSYQTSAGIPDSTHMRAIPDVALDADPNSGVRVYENGSGSYTDVGGTSLACPLMAGIDVISLCSIGLHLNHAYLYDVVYPTGAGSSYNPQDVSLYNAWFRDVTSGDNGYYVCTTGWDPVTGLGSITFHLGYNDTLQTFDATLGSIGYDIYGTINAGQGYYGAYYITSNDSTVAFFVCNSTNFNTFINNPTTLPPSYYSYSGGTYNYWSWDFLVPKTGTWYFVFWNRVVGIYPTAHILYYQDLTGPAIIISSPSSSGSYSSGSTITIAANAMDDQAWYGAGATRVRVSVTNSSGSVLFTAQSPPSPSSDNQLSASWTTPANLPSGYYYVTFSAWDAPGNLNRAEVTISIQYYTAPTIDQPSSITFVAGTTGHSITWHPNAGNDAPYNYSITESYYYYSGWSRFTGSSTMSSGSWNGSALSQIVDGLPVGSDHVNCTVFDLHGKKASSVVAVTVQPKNIWAVGVNTGESFQYTVTQSQDSLGPLPYSWLTSGTTWKLVVLNANGAYGSPTMSTDLASGAQCDFYVNGVENTTMSPLNDSIVFLSFAYLPAFSPSGASFWNTYKSWLTSKGIIQYTITVGSKNVTWSYNSAAGRVVLAGTMESATIDIASGVLLNYSFTSWSQTKSFNLKYVLTNVGPTINQPSPITYVAGTTGHNITWTPFSERPKNYAISVNGGSPKSYTWNGSTVTYSVDGLSVGTNTVNCTVYDQSNKYASSSVTVTVSPAPTTPSAPLSLKASASNGQVNLTWSAPSSNGGAAITGYKIYRGTSSGGESATPIATVGNVTSYTDTSTSNGQTYYYEVSAVNSVGEGSKSSEVSATPSNGKAPSVAVPTINQPSAITYTVGTTGHSITWSPSSTIPDYYTISVNGGSPTRYTWTGGTITYNVDGLAVGTYTVTCTVYDTQGRSTSSTVTVTVKSAPTPLPTSSLLLIAVVGLVGVVVVIGILVAVKKRKPVRKRKH
jgi:hypothetical protein